MGPRPGWRLGLVLLGLTAGACGSTAPAHQPSLTDEVLAFVQRSQADHGGSYRRPDGAAAQRIASAVLSLGDGREEQARGQLAQVRYRERPLRSDPAVRLVIPATEPDPRGWGLYAVRRGGLAVAVEVPHPRADRQTETLGAQLAERLQAGYFLVAGARRDRDGGAADVAHESDSVFTAVHARIAERGLPAVQVHGFDPSSSPGNDVVVSPGSTPLSDLARRTADAVEAAGFVTCRVWRQACGPLEGRTNAQSEASLQAGVPFVHVEIVRAVRQDEARRADLLTALVTAARTAGAPPADGS